VVLGQQLGRTSVSRSLSCTHVQQVWAPVNKFFQLRATTPCWCRAGVEQPRVARGAAPPSQGLIDRVVETQLACMHVQCMHAQHPSERRPGGGPHGLGQ
jgi:hypothetical protein